MLPRCLGRSVCASAWGRCHVAVARRSALGYPRALAATATALSSEKPAPSAPSLSVEKPAQPPDLAHFHRRPRLIDEQLDLNHLLTQPVYGEEEREGVQKTHRETKSIADSAALRSVQLLRFGFDVASGYLWKNRTHSMREADWLRRITFLETVAGVPGMVAGVIRHLQSLGLMRRDHGWIHSLLSEAENERMHLLIALRLKKPGILFRGAVITAQMVFVTYYTLAYAISPHYCHRFVGYLEEEAVTTYSHLLEEIDAGRLPLFEQMPAPRFASTYYHLPKGAMLRDVFACIRADEAHHRDTNHHFADLRPDQPNELVEHLRRNPATEALKAKQRGTSC